MARLKLVDVRAKMPNYENYKDWERDGDITGIAIHHSATADYETGAPSGSAASFFDYHVNVRGWSHGGYHYVILGDGTVEYALDEKIGGYHAGFKDPSDQYGLEYGQYWNNHYLAICLCGWFEDGRTYVKENKTYSIPDDHTYPTDEQMESLYTLLTGISKGYDIPVENIRGHGELEGTSTRCPGGNFKISEIRDEVRHLLNLGPSLPEPLPGEHVLILPDEGEYLQDARAYILLFQPDVTFEVETAVGRWPYVTVVGSPAEITEEEVSLLKQNGAQFVQRIYSDGQGGVRALFEKLVSDNTRFYAEENGDDTEEPQEPEWKEYTVQSGDSLSLIARREYGKSSLWPVIFEANRDVLTSPSLLRVGQVLKIPPAPAG